MVGRVSGPGASGPWVGRVGVQIMQIYICKTVAKVSEKKHF